MLHHVIFWKMAKRVVDVDDDGLAVLLERDRRNEIYVEFVDGKRRWLAWDGPQHRWMSVSIAEPAAA